MKLKEGFYLSIEGNSIIEVKKSKLRRRMVYIHTEENTYMVAYYSDAKIILQNWEYLGC